MVVFTASPTTMAMRPPPRSAPFTDWEDVVATHIRDFNGQAAAAKLPESAKELWSEQELQLFFASGGAIMPLSDPKQRAAAAQMTAKADLRSQAQKDEDMLIEQAREAAQKAPWWAQVSDLDKEKAAVYRDAAVTRGIPARPHGLFPVDDPLIQEYTKQRKTLLPFEKHILYWDQADGSPAKDGAARCALHADEGFTHGDSACVGRGLDFRYYWDSVSLKVVAAVRYSRAAVGGWSCAEDEISPPWGSTLVHGGCIESVMDELTAEVMKINISPEMVTSEFSVKLKRPSVPGVSYRAEAAITSVAPPKVTIDGTIKTMSGEVVCEARAICVMLDKMPKPAGQTQSFHQDPASIDATGVLSVEEAMSTSMSQQLLRGRACAPNRSGDGGGGGPSEHHGGASLDEAIAELQKLQRKVVGMLQDEYFCDDVEPPPEAFGWGAERLKQYFENGGED